MNSRILLRFLMAIAMGLCLFGWTSLPLEAAQVNGFVRWEGSVPVEEVIPVEPRKGSHSTEGCPSTKASFRLKVDPSGGIAHCVVWLEIPGEQERKEDPSPILLDQRECEFIPHVLAIPLGSPLRIRNSDPIRHNIRIFQEGNPSLLIHRWQRAKGPDITWRFTKPGRFVVRCGIHPWMYAWVMVTEHRYTAVTDSQGNFAFPSVPEGNSTLHLWHETLGEKKIPLKIHQGKPVFLPIFFSKKGDGYAL